MHQEGQLQHTLKRSAETRLDVRMHTDRYYAARTSSVGSVFCGSPLLRALVASLSEDAAMSRCQDGKE